MSSAKVVYGLDIHYKYEIPKVTIAPPWTSAPRTTGGSACPGWGLGHMSGGYTCPGGDCPDTRDSTNPHVFRPSHNVVLQPS